MYKNEGEFSTVLSEIVGSSRLEASEVQGSHSTRKHRLKQDFLPRTNDNFYIKHPL